MFHVQTKTITKITNTAWSCTWFSLSSPCFPWFNSMQLWQKPCSTWNLSWQCLISMPDSEESKILASHQKLFFINLETLKGKVPQNKDLQRNLLPSETSMDYTKCMKLTKKHGIVSENMEYTRMFWSLILPIHHNMKHEMATFCETRIHNFYFHAPYTRY